MTTQDEIEKMLKKSEQIINAGQFEETPTKNYMASQEKILMSNIIKRSFKEWM